MRCLKDTILKALAFVNAGSLFFCVGCMDNNSRIPFIVALINLGYLALFAYANGIFNTKKEGDIHVEI